MYTQKHIWKDELTRYGKTMQDGDKKKAQMYKINYEKIFVKLINGNI